MNTKTSIAASVVLVLIGGGLVFFFSGRTAMQIGTAIITLIAIGALWLLKSFMRSNSQKAERLDKDSKALLEYIHGKFNEKGIKEIGRQTHGLTAAMMLKMKQGEIDGEEQLLKTLRPVPADKFDKVRDIKYLAATLTSHYLTADENSETRLRLNQFIKGDYQAG